jgi:hypothetical protein
MTTEEKLVMEYFPEIKDINGSEPISALPLTLVDMLEEYREMGEVETGRSEKP